MLIINTHTKWPEEWFHALSEESPFPLDSLSPGQITTKLDSFYRLSLGVSQTLHNLISFSVCFLSCFSLEGGWLPQGDSFYLEVQSLSKTIGSKMRKGSLEYNEVFLFARIWTENFNLFSLIIPFRLWNRDVLMDAFLLHRLVSRCNL